MKLTSRQLKQIIKEEIKGNVWAVVDGDDGIMGFVDALDKGQAMDAARKKLGNAFHNAYGSVRRSSAAEKSKWEKSKRGQKVSARGRGMKSSADLINDAYDLINDAYIALSNASVDLGEEEGLLDELSSVMISLDNLR